MTESEELENLQLKGTSLFFRFYENVTFMKSICGLVWGHSTKSVMVRVIKHLCGTFREDGKWGEQYFLLWKFVSTLFPELSAS